MHIKPYNVFFNIWNISRTRRVRVRGTSKKLEAVIKKKEKEKEGEGEGSEEEERGILDAVPLIERQWERLEGLGNVVGRRGRGSLGGVGRGWETILMGARRGRRGR